MSETLSTHLAAVVEETNLGTVAKRRLVLHAGIHRTGSTSIQAALSKHRAALAGQGVIYPRDIVTSDEGNDAASANHANLAWALNQQRIEASKIRDWLLDVANEDSRVILLSAEDFCVNRELSYLDCLLEHFDVELIIYLRRQDEWINSWYNQHIRWPFDATLSTTTPLEFLGYIERFHWLKYFDMLERWAKYLGREKIHVRIFETGTSDTVSDLFSFLGLETSPDMAALRTNESSPADHLGLLRQIGLMNYPRHTRVRILQLVSALPSARSPNVYPAGVRKLLFERYTNQNRAVAEKYLQREDGILFRDCEFPDDAPDLLAPQSFNDEWLLDIVGKLLKEQKSTSG